MIKIRQEEAELKTQRVMACIVYNDMSRDSMEYEMLAQVLTLHDFHTLKEVAAEAHRFKQNGKKITQAGRDQAIDWAWAVFYLETMLREPFPVQESTLDEKKKSVD